MRAVLAVLACLVACAVAVKPIGDWNDGYITHYGGAQDNMDPNSPSFGTSEGSCGYGSISKSNYPYFSVAAFSPSNSFYLNDPLHACGECFQVQCTGSMASDDLSVCIKDSEGNPLSILVMISDECPECAADHIDVQSLAFAKLADPGLGNIQVQYRQVECAVPQDMKISVMNYVSTGGWLRLSVDDTGGYAAVTGVQVRTTGSGGSWTSMDNTWGATWELGQAPSPPLDFRVSCVDGEVIEATNVVTGTSDGSVSDTTVYSTGVQFNITDPALDSISVASGSTDPMVVTSSTPGNTDILAGDGSTTNTDGATVSSSSSSSLDISASPNSSPSSPSSSPSSPSSPSAPTSPSASTSPSSSSSPSASPSSCDDVPPDENASCDQRKTWGQCDDAYLTQGNYCADSCGRCAEGGSSPTAGSASPTPNSPSSCADIPPDTSATCAQRLQWGQCDAYYVTNGNYCANSCGRCNGSTSPSVSASSGPSTSTPPPPARRRA